MVTASPSDWKSAAVIGGGGATAVADLDWERWPISSVVSIAEILKNNGFAVEKKITTSTVEIRDDSRGRPVQKAKIEVVLGKTANFDQLMASAQEAIENGNSED
ncbi:hypothetical protein CASFOL_032015 [Castilleja foliolosa]|uniref:Uncharacterized protein n=1 Tax=Castilleja foliolosa TaxID=1961234 RepID=A0ABD3C1L8_9LAMI